MNAISKIVFIFKFLLTKIDNYTIFVIKIMMFYVYFIIFEENDY